MSRAARPHGVDEFIVDVLLRILDDTLNVTRGVIDYEVCLTRGMSCEAVPVPLTGAGMRRHVHTGKHAAESFVRFIPLFGGPAHPAWVVPRSAEATRLHPCSSTSGHTDHSGTRGS